MDRAVLPATTRRGRDTRAGLLDAARRVFERDGYDAARIGDIAVEAGVAHGTFYAHFRSKPEVFLAVMTDLWSRLLLPVAPPDIEGRSVGVRAASPYDRVLDSNRHFLAGYRAHAGLFALVDEAARTAPEIDELRRRVHEDNTRRVARAIRRWQRVGVAAPDLRAADAATALVGMVGRAAYHWYVVERRRTTRPEARTLTTLWLRALGIAVGSTPGPAVPDRGE